MVTIGYKKIMIFLSTDKHPSPFDIQMMYDAGADHVIYYGEVMPENCKQIILDAMFPRGPEGVKYTAMFIGGNKPEPCVEIAEIAKKTMFPPFEIATVVDPQGGYTTAAALVAMVEHCLKNVCGINPVEVKYAIVGGTGRVGRSAAFLLAKDGAKVRIVSRSHERAMKRSKEINEKLGVERVEGFGPAKAPEEILEACKDAEVVITTGPPGVQLVPKSVLEKLEKCRVVADVNAVPPTGIEGLKPSKKCKPILGNILGIGALAIGNLKNQVEMELIKSALEAPKGFFELEKAYECARKILGI